MDTKTLELIILSVGTVLLPTLGWFASYTLGRLRAMESRIEVILEAKSTMVTRNEFNTRMDTLTNLILNNLPHNLHKGAAE